MTLGTRITRLEQTAREAVGGSGAGDELARQLIQIADRTEGTVLNEEWCSHAAPIEVAAKCFRELETGANSPTLWQRADELRHRDGNTGKLFNRIMEARSAA